MFRMLKYVLVCIAHVTCVAGILKLFYLVSPYFLQNFFSIIVHIIVCLFIARYTFIFTKRYFLNEKISSHKKAVLITGCDSGFGHLLAKRLDSRGFYVFAACLYPTGEGAEKLRNQCSDRFKVLEMNVVKDDSVEAAFQFVKDNLDDSVLWAIVNNAGVIRGITIDLCSLQSFKDTMEVNGFGMVRVTKTFLPLLKKSKGRIVNVTSYAGRFAIPMNTAYVMSKFAATGFSDSLRKEMKDFGIRVIEIEPESFRTMITDSHAIGKELDTQLSVLDPALVEEYGEEYFKNLKLALQNVLKKYPSTNFDRVVDTLEDAVSAQYPNISYRPCRNDLLSLLSILAEMMPHAVADIATKVFLHISSFPIPKAV